MPKSKQKSAAMPGKRGYKHKGIAHQTTGGKRKKNPCKAMKY